jgi:F-type H+-transporting ATPase subunit a
MYVTMFEAAMLAEFNPLKPIVAKRMFTFCVGGHEVIVTNHMFMIAVATVLLGVMVPLVMRRKGLVPRGLRNAVEALCVYIREEVAKPMLHERTDRFIGYIWTTFFFILTLNLLSLFPSEYIIHVFTGKENHFGGPATANIWVTGALAILSFIITHVAGVKRQGLGHYLANIAPKVHWAILPLIYFLEVVSMLIRPCTLAIRLFANMVGGHTLIATLLGLILVFKNYFVAGASVGATVAMSLMELLVAFIQAYIFTFLATVYIAFAVEPEH